MKTILFICTGNTCRSSMAQGLFNEMVKRDTALRGIYSAASAGTDAWDGDFASEHSIRVLSEKYGIDIGLHRSRQVTLRHIEEAFLVLTMTAAHRRALLSLYPQAADKTFTLKEYVDEKATGLDIPDPFGYPAEAYAQCASDLYRNIQKLLEKLKNEDFST